MSREWHNWLPFRPTAYMHWIDRLDKDGGGFREQSERWIPYNQYATALLISAFDRDLFSSPPRAQMSILAKAMPKVVLPEILNQLDDTNLPSVNGIKVIVGVVDTDIALGHRCFRNKDGSSRVLMHWQMDMDGNYSTTNNSGNDLTIHIPKPKAGADAFGQVLLQHQINAMLSDCSGGDLLAELDEQRFNTAVGALNMKNPRGHHGLLGRYAHGAHVLDIAAGAAAGSPFSEEVGIVTVGLPPRWDYGEAGENLDLMMALAINQIANISYRLWKKEYEGKEPGNGFIGLPTVVNLSFGRQAGAKRPEADWFPVLLDTILANSNGSDSNTQGQTRAPFDVVMPAGNDNQRRVSARYTLAPGDEPIDVNWQLLPGDQTDNHVEVWAESDDCLVEPTPHLAVALAPPGQTATAPERGELGTYQDVPCANAGGAPGFGARIYRLVEPAQTKETTRAGYLIATGPTDTRTDEVMAVPQGLWKIRLKNHGKCPISVTLSVQTDQSVLPVAGTTGSSYLDCPTYEILDSQGRSKDAVRWDRQNRSWHRDEAESGTLRHGTINAASCNSSVATIAGYRLSDGVTSLYSATGAGNYGSGARNAPTAALPSDCSIVLGDMLGAGAADGTRVPMRGTSFACARATRYVAEEWLFALTKAEKLSDASTLLSLAAMSQEENKPYDIALTMPEGPGEALIGAEWAKYGHGRIADPNPLAPRRRNTD